MTAIESYGVRSQAAEKLAVANMRLWSFTISKSSNILLKCDFFGEADENSLSFIYLIYCQQKIDF